MTANLLTYASLRALWKIRDERYARRRLYHVAHPLSPAEESAVIANRRREVGMLGRTVERVRAAEALAAWRPPVPARRS